MKHQAMKWWGLSCGLALLTFTGCNANYTLDPTGFACDPGGVCPTGFHCSDQNVCMAGSQSCTCSAPPQSVCVGSVARSFVGRCVYASCQFDPIDTVCPNGCSNGACNTQACSASSCTTPPKSTCLNGTTLRTFAAQGTCENSGCAYAATEVACKNGCENNACKGADLCAGLVCQTPPAPSCVGNTAKTPSATGTCDPGTGTCTYPVSDQVCPQACSSGLCVSQNLAFTQVGPRVRFAINAIDVAPSGGTVLAVGNAGKVARWNGTEWKDISTPSVASDLRSVAFVGPQVAYLVGTNRTLWAWRSNTSSLTPVVLAVDGGTAADFTQVYGRSESEVLVTASSGEFWKFDGGTWAVGALPASTGPYQINSAYIDEQHLARLAGLCNNSGGANASCVLKAAPGDTFSADLNAGSRVGFTAVGGSFNPASSLSSLAMVGRADTTLVNHDGASGNFTDVNTLTEGDSIVGITAENSLLPRSVFVLTSSARHPGHLYQLDTVLTTITSKVVVDTYLGEETLSRSVAQGTTPGVIVAEVNRLAGANNVFRHSTLVDEAFDLGLDFAAVSVDPLGTLFVTNSHGDVGLKRTTQATWEFHRAQNMLVRGLEARNGAAVLLVGKDATAQEGAIYRWLPTGALKAASKPNTTFNSVCRVSDTEGWAVGTQGTVYSVTGLSAAQVSSGTTKDLLFVDCQAASASNPIGAVACGNDSTVLALRNSTWSPLTPAFPSNGKTFTQCRVSGGAVFVAGDGVFAKFEGGTWTTLTPKAGLTSFLVRSPTEIYGAAVTAPSTTTSPAQSSVFRFDGSQWVSVLPVSGQVGGGVQTSSKVVFAGSGGLLIEGR